MAPIKFCYKCCNEGLDIDGNICECRLNVKSFYDTVSCLDIPEQYRGIQFNKMLVAKDMPEAYAEYLDSIHQEICSNRWKNHNLCLCSPTAKSKTILAYSCMESLFRHGVEIFPLYDVLELKRIMLDMDLCRQQLYGTENPEKLFTAALVFIRIPRVITWEIYDTMVTILDRRVRRGNSTIFLYNGSWEQLIKLDKMNVLAGLLGDGSYNSIENKTWFPLKAEDTAPEIELDGSLG